MKERATFFAGFIGFLLYSQNIPESRGKVDTTNLKIKAIEQVVIEGSTIGRLDPVSGTYLYSGKKNEVISLQKIDANVTEKTARQIFAKIPGVFVYDMEGGNQLNISMRGLDPHRGWELNLRKDGIITNSDMYAYPASHYSIPMESVEKIEIVRGTGSLQYGAQFGGMVNYISRQGDATKPLSFESYNTIGSFGLLSTYNAIGGKVGKFKYYIYISKRSRNGYRDNEHTIYDAEGIDLIYEPTVKLSFRFDFARSNYTYRLPGPLTDAMFNDNPRQATRSRNYFSPTINIPSLTMKWNIAENTKLQLISSAIIGERNSVLFDKVATLADVINPITLQYANRQVDIDRFNSYTQELRILQSYTLGNQKSSLAAGIQLMTNDLHRTQLGKGTTGSDDNFSLVDPVWGRDLHFKTRNIAIFAENNFVITHNFSANVGARLETGESKMNGTIVYYPENQIPVSLNHHFPLFGASFIYKPLKNSDIYGGISQAYRSMLFKDIVPGSAFEKVDPNIKDAKGYNAELGYRGAYKFLQWDITGFLLKYNNRFGTLVEKDHDGNFYTYKTNIGDALTKGLEIFIQSNFKINESSDLILFTSTSWMNGRYVSGNIKSGNSNISVEHNRIDSVPSIITRNGLTYQWKHLSATFLLNHTSKTFADAFNTETPNETGTVGLVPAYTILDFNATFKFSNNFEIKASLNNLGNHQYFTKRPQFYPGPGVWPSDGRGGALSFIFKM